MSVSITLNHLTKEFVKDKGVFRAVDDVHLQIEKGELLTFLGPSGCGKTTTLRMVAGFETPSDGNIAFDGRDVTNIMVNRREIGFVFQNYALFPHMTIFDNVAFGLRAHQYSNTIIEKRVWEYLDLVGLNNTERRYPNQLSGGEQQRVALARVLVMQPQVLLMDEPLSNLDAKLRIHMRTEIRRLQKQLNLTCLYVTHDQKEALTIADRIVVMEKGRVEQVGTPFDLYSKPQSLFVADFIGQANVLQGVMESDEGAAVHVRLENGALLSAKKVSGKDYVPGAKVTVIARPETMFLGPRTENMVYGKVVSRTFLGDRLDYEVEILDRQTVHIEENYSSTYRLVPEGGETWVGFRQQDLAALPTA